MAAVSCEKEPEARKTTQEQLLGKWRLQLSQEEYYKPATTLVDSESYTGEPGDSVVFKPGNVLYGYTDADYEEMEYRLENDHTLYIEQEAWKIASLTDKELTLVQEETVMDERYVLRLFMVR